MPTVFKTNADFNRPKTKDTNTDRIDPDDHLFISHITIYRSGVVLASYLIALELIFLLINLIIRVPLGFLSTSINPNILLSINTYLYLGLVFIKLILMIIIVFQWLDNYYEVRAGKIIYKTGFFKRDERAFDCPDIFKLDLSQGFWGRLFNFGTITLFVKPTKDSFSLTNIPSPHRNLRLLEKSLAHKRVEITLSEEEVLEDEN